MGPILALSSLIAFTLFGFEPSRALARNWEQLAIGFGDLALHLMLPFGGAFLALFLLALLLAGVAGERAVSLLVGFYVGLWLQTSVFVWAYGPFDGSTLRWDDFAWQRGLEVAVWAGVLAYSLWKGRLIRRYVRPIVACVFALYAVSFAELIASEAPYAPRVQAEGVGAGIAPYSTDRNALVFVLDSLQSDFFAELLLDSDFAAAVPPGFSYFRNATSYYGSTQFSLQSIMTSAHVPDHVNAKRFVHAEMKRSLPSRLGELGFSASISTFDTGNIPGCKPTLGPYTCVRMSEFLAADGATASRDLWRADVSSVLRVAFFRSVPQVLKQQIRGRRDWVLPPLFPPIHAPSRIDPRIHEDARNDLLALERLTREVSVVPGSPSFRLIHLFSPHHPVSLDGECRYVDTTELENLKRWQTIAAARCILLRVFDYLRALDAAGGYDATGIFIVADHGSYFNVEHAFAKPPLPAALHTGPGFDWTFRGIPLFLAKPPGARAGLQTSDRPVALCDVPNSVYEVFGLPVRAACTSVFAANPARELRHYYRYPDYFEQKRLGQTSFEFDDYVIDGHAWYPASWRRAE